MICPRCGKQMTLGAPHGNWNIQWECYGRADNPASILMHPIFGNGSGCGYIWHSEELPEEEGE